MTPSQTGVLNLYSGINNLAHEATQYVPELAKGLARDLTVLCLGLQDIAPSAGSRIDAWQSATEKSQVHLSLPLLTTDFPDHVRGVIGKKLAQHDLSVEAASRLYQEEALVDIPLHIEIHPTVITTCAASLDLFVAKPEYHQHGFILTYGVMLALDIGAAISGKAAFSSVVFARQIGYAPSSGEKLDLMTLDTRFGRPEKSGETLETTDRGTLYFTRVSTKEASDTDNYHLHLMGRSVKRGNAQEEGLIKVKREGSQRRIINFTDIMADIINYMTLTYSTSYPPFLPDISNLQEYFEKTR